MVEVLKLAAFSQNGQGGNPAGVAFYDAMPSDEEMLAVAKEVGFSETAFLVKQGGGWRVRYFAPAMEVPFCGHATIALGAVLGERYGEGTYQLYLNDGPIRVHAAKSDWGFSATLQSPKTGWEDAPQGYVDRILASFELAKDRLDPRFPIRLARAGSNKHLIIFLKDRKTLAEISYPFEEVRALMNEGKLTTISFLWQESESLFHARNPFASGGVYEDPATGAAAAALTGYLRGIRWKGPDTFVILQGEDMGMPSRLTVTFPKNTDDGALVGGEVRYIQ